MDECKQNRCAADSESPHGARTGAPSAPSVGGMDNRAAASGQERERGRASSGGAGGADRAPVGRGARGGRGRRGGRRGPRPRRAIGRRIVCAPRLPDACRHHPLVPAYGWPLARLARALAPAPQPLGGPDGLPLVPVDFRRCRQGELRRRRRSPPDRLEPAHHGLHPAPRPPPRRRHRGDRLLGVPPVARLARRPPHRDPGGHRSRRRDRGAARPRTPHWSPSRPSPAATTTTSPPREKPPWRWQVEARYPGWSD